MTTITDLEPALKEAYLQHLMADMYREGMVNVYDHAADAFSTDMEAFGHIKCWADHLVREKLATYTDTVHSTLELTNFGRYWVMKGGYESFLRDGHCVKEKPREKTDLAAEKEKLINARLRLTKYRLTYFWMALIISSVGFLLSVLNLYLMYRKW